MAYPPIRLPGRLIVTVSPSDLTFLLNECQRCFYRKVIEGRRRPSTPMPRVFTTMDRRQRSYYSNQATKLISPELPAGTIITMTAQVSSRPIPIPGTSVSMCFRGTTDAELMFDDGTWGIVDFKTTHPADPHVALYTHQLHAYAYALEQPSYSSSGVEVSVLGLLCIEPDQLVTLADGMAYRVDPTWMPVERDDAAFMAYLAEAASFLQAGAPPPAGPRCDLCALLALYGDDEAA